MYTKLRRWSWAMMLGLLPDLQSSPASPPTSYILSIADWEGGDSATKFPWILDIRLCSTPETIETYIYRLPVYIFTHGYGGVFPSNPSSMNGWIKSNMFFSLALMFECISDPRRYSAAFQSKQRWQSIDCARRRRKNYTYNNPSQNSTDYYWKLIWSIILRYCLKLDIPLADNVCEFKCRKMVGRLKLINWY